MMHGQKNIKTGNVKLWHPRCVRYNKMVQDSTVETQLIMWCSIYC